MSKIKTKTKTKTTAPQQRTPEPDETFVLSALHAIQDFMRVMGSIKGSSVILDDPDNKRAFEELHLKLQHEIQNHLLQTAMKITELKEELASIKVDLIDRQHAANKRMTTFYISIIGALAALQIAKPLLELLLTR